MVLPSSLAGVPVLKRATESPSATSEALSPWAARSPERPPTVRCSPTCMTPERKVPVVTTVASAMSSSPARTPTTRGAPARSLSSSVASASTTVIRASARTLAPISSA